ncbi:MAG: cupin domain-containing protein [Planctomycetota bacterium]|nr:cupin domain-containing protein [Planctomycetota bacterium]
MGTFSSKGDINMAGVKEIRASFEILESKRPLAGDVTISRGDIVAPEVVLINNDVVGPSPIVFEKVDFFNNDIPSFVVGHVANGVVEKYDTSSQTWKNISAVPTSSNPRELLNLLSRRIFQEGEQLRWIPGSNSDMREAFTVIGWDNGNSVVKEAPNYSGANNTEWPNYVPNQELGFGQLNNLVVQLENSQTAAGSDFDLAWLSSLPSGPKVEPTHFYPVTEINGQTLPGEMKALQNVIDLVPPGYIDSFGREVVIHRGIREAGTRVGIHIHEYGGYTLVLSGTITDYVQGMEPMTHGPGDWYYMPPDTPMSAANLGTEDAELIDIFFVPPGQPSITIIEPGWPSDDADGTSDGP